MTYSVSTLWARNLRDVFENDPARRRRAIEEIFAEDCVSYDPQKGVYRGRDEIDRIAGAVKATHPDFRYQPMGAPEESGNGGRIQWVSSRPGEVPAYAGLISSLPGTTRSPPCISIALICQSTRLTVSANDASDRLCEQTRPESGLSSRKRAPAVANAAVPVRRSSRSRIELALHGRGFKNAGASNPHPDSA